MCSCAQTGSVAAGQIMVCVLNAPAIITTVKVSGLWCVLIYMIHKISNTEICAHCIIVCHSS